MKTTFPQVLKTLSNISKTSSVLVISACIKRLLQPNFSEAKRIAVASPIPVGEPVIKTFLPFNLWILIHFEVVQGHFSLLVVRPFLETGLLL